MERRRFVSFNLTLFFFFFLLLPHLHASKSCFNRFMHVLSNALVHTLSLEIFCILKLKHDFIYIYIYTHTHGNRFGYLSECKTHNRLPHQLSSILINRLRPSHHTPLVKLKWVRFESVQTGLVGCRQNLNRPHFFITFEVESYFIECHMNQQSFLKYSNQVFSSFLYQFKQF